jgi:hypothetical protein
VLLKSAQLLLRTAQCGAAILAQTASCPNRCLLLSEHSLHKLVEGLQVSCL